MKNIIFVFVAIILLSGCKSDTSKTQDKKDNSLGFDLKPLNGGKYGGGVFVYNEEEYLRDLFTLNITEVIGHRISTNIYEGLVTMSQDELKIVPSLAESWTISDDGKTYTFKIRKGVKFHDDPCFAGGKGREVTAKDFKYALDLLCTNIAGNEGFWIFKDKVVGAEAHFKATKGGKSVPGGVKGIKLVDDNTLSIEIMEPFSDFIRLLVTPFTYVQAEEAFKKYGANGLRTHAVGTGPFTLVKVADNEAVLMRKNPNYWDKDAAGNQLPYLDGLKVGFIKEKKSSLLEFKKGKMHMLYRLPYEMVDNVLNEARTALRPEYKQYQLQIEETLGYQYYGFQNKTKPFDNKKLRKAFCYAVDRQKVVDFVLKGMGTPAHNGFIPPGFKKADGYDVSQVKGYKYDPQMARKLMAEAGYPGGKGLGKITLQINSGGGRNSQIAEAIQKQLEETLNIDIEIQQMPFAQHLETCETGKAIFWRAGWLADYVSPENFMRLYYGKSVPSKLEEKSYLNTTRYQNAKYDKAFEAALSSIDKTKRHQYYRQAEQTMIDDAPAIPIFFDKDIRLLHPNIRNFPQNAMEYRYFKDVYFVPDGK